MEDPARAGPPRPAQQRRHSGANTPYAADFARFIFSSFLRTISRLSGDR